MFGFGKKNTIVIKVNGMHCGKCAEKVQKAVMSVDGAKKAVVDLDAKCVTVIATDSFDVAKAVAAVNALGFEVVA